MSQAKVDRYKEEKKNRAKMMRRQKIERRLAEAGAVVVAILVVVWVGVSVYRYTGNSNSTSTVNLPTYTVNTDSLDNYLNSLSVD